MSRTKKEFVDLVGRTLTGHIAKTKKPIQTGWAAFRAIHQPTPEQEQLLRHAYFAGAQHLYACIMAGIDPSHDVTKDDLQMMENVHNELQAFYEEMKKLLIDQPGGSA